MAHDDTPGEVQPFWRAFTPDDSPKTPDDIANDPAYAALRTAQLKEGDIAYDFDLPIYDFSDGVEQATGERFGLRERAASKPTALIFGSYT